MASALTPEGTLSSSKTTLWGNALLFTNSTVSPLATVILLGCEKNASEGARGQRLVECAKKKSKRSSTGWKPGKNRGCRQTCLGGCPSRYLEMDCVGRTPGDRAECGWNTHEETELAVVTAELDGGGEGGGGEEDGGDTDDGGLRG